MKYFKMRMIDAFTAHNEVWRRQDLAGIQRSVMSTSGSEYVSTWTQDLVGETMLRIVLKELKIEYEEGEKQQVVTWLDEAFGE